MMRTEAASALLALDKEEVISVSSLLALLKGQVTRLPAAYPRSTLAMHQNSIAPDRVASGTNAEIVRLSRAIMRSPPLHGRVDGR